MWNIYEQPWTLLITAVILIPVVAVISVFIKSKYKSMIWLIPVLVAVAGPLIDFAVKTDREKILYVIDTGVKAVENEDCDSIAAIISDNYTDSANQKKTTLLSRCRSMLRPPAVDKIYDSIRDLQISGDTATADTLLRIFFDPQSYYAEFSKILLVQVQINLKKNPEGKWLITGIEILAVNGQPSGWGSVNY